MAKDVHPAGNFYDKYNTKNPIERMLMKGFFNTAAQMISEAELTEGTPIMEAGCAEGKFSAFLSSILPGHHIEAFDISAEVIKIANSQKGDMDAHFYTDDIYSIATPDAAYEFVACSEVLEHIERPADGLRELERVSSKYIFVSVPNEPIWCMLNMVRGAYIKDWGNTPGHINHWNMHSLKKLIRENSSLEIISSRRSLPWLLILLKKTK